jgi:hypothetical protein
MGMFRNELAEIIQLE